MSSKNYYYKLFRVTKSCGKISTISMDPVLVTKACQVLGGLEKVNEFAKETALKYYLNKVCISILAENNHQPT